MIRSPIVYFGGKYFLRNHILSLMPNHTTYVEPFFGAGWVFFGKEPSRIEVINDKDENIFSLYKVLQDADKCAELIRRLEYTPYHQKEFMRALELYRNRSWRDDVERAWCTYVRFLFSVSGTGRSFSLSWVKSRVKQHLNVDFRLSVAHKRIKNAQIRCEDALALLKRVPENERILIYADPPYVGSTRVSKDVYAVEMSDDEHVELVNILLNFKRTKVIVSGYEHEIYKPLEDNGWNVKRIHTTAYSRCLRSRTTTEPKRSSRVEVLWWNY